MSDINTNPFGITRKEILELAANKIADQFGDDETIQISVEKKIDQMIKSQFGTALINRVDTFLQSEMEKLLSQEICPVDIYGEKCGTPTTIRNVLAERARVFWDTKVSEDGKPQDGYYGKPRHEWLFAKIVNEEFTKAVKQNVVNLVGSFKDALSESANKITKEHIDSLIKVKTARD